MVILDQKHKEIEEYLKQIFLMDSLMPSIREVARKFNMHNHQLSRDHKEIVDKIVLKRRQQMKKLMAKKDKSVFPVDHMRDCLGCSQRFLPKSKFNRLCDSCKNKEYWV